MIQEEVKLSNLCEIVETTKCHKAIGKRWCWTNRTSLWGRCITKKTLRKPNQFLNLSAITNFFLLSTLFGSFQIQEKHPVLNQYVLLFGVWWISQRIRNSVINGRQTRSIWIADPSNLILPTNLVTWNRMRKEKSKTSWDSSIYHLTWTGAGLQAIVPNLLFAVWPVSSTKMSILSSRTILAIFFSSIPYISFQTPPFFNTLSLNLYVFASACKAMRNKGHSKEENAMRTKKMNCFGRKYIK